jgi:DNA-directed RNA polymerase specialized sigma subunit
MNEPLSIAEQKRLVGLVEVVARRLHPQNESELEEFVSAGLVGLADALRTWDPARSKLSTYAVRKIRWAIIDYLERCKPALSLDGIEEDLGPVFATEGRFFYDHEPPSERYLLGLTPRQRQVMQMRYWEGLAPKQVQRRLGIGKACVCLHQQRALDTIRQRLQESRVA